MNWPRASEKGRWATVNSDLRGALEGLNGTVGMKLEKMGGLIYEHGSGRFGVCESRKKVVLEIVKSMWQQEINSHVLE